MAFCVVVPMGVHVVLLVRGLDVNTFRGALPHRVLAALATWSCAALSLKRPTCNRDVFLHASTSS
jgi:hypothetical protein